MPWLKKKAHHDCNLPQKGGVGSEWQCRKCKQKWRLVARTTPPSGYRTSMIWRKFS